jgi:hypothetical protein
MPICRAQVIIPNVNNNPADNVINTWGFELDDASSGGAVSATTALGQFYNYGTTYRSPNFNWSLSTVRWFNMEDPEPRVPFAQPVLVTSPSAGSPSLPHELAVCMSFQGSTGSGFNMRRRRGRLYLGPFASNANGTGGVVLPALRTAIANAADTFLGLSGTTDWQWGVISMAGIGVGFTPVVSGWVDDAWDIQRRRGLRPTTRTTFS